MDKDTAQDHSGKQVGMGSLPSPITHSHTVSHYRPFWPLSFSSYPMYTQ